MTVFTQRFTQYFGREVAKKAARSLSDGAEIEFWVGEETFTFTKVKGDNVVLPSGASDPQIVLRLTPGAAQAILYDTSEDIGKIGANIAQLIINRDPLIKIQFQLKAGFLTLFSKGYFGVVTAGGSSFASFLASKGINGMGAIKEILKKLKTG